MKVRAIDSFGDWQFGKGRNDYKQNLKALVQNISTRLNSFLGDCFFSTGDGVDWFNIIGTKNTLAIELAVAAAILNTEGVTALLQLSVTLSPSSRNVFLSYEVDTVYGRGSGFSDFNPEV